MRNGILAATLACLASIGLNAPAEVPVDVADHSGTHQYDIGVRAEQEACPTDKADTIVVYSAKWCGPCRLMSLQWKTLRSDGYKVVYIDVDDPHKHDGEWKYQTPEFVDKCAATEVKVIPTVRYYNSSTGEWLDETLTGYRTLNTVKKPLWKPSS